MIILHVKQRNQLGYFSLVWLTKKNEKKKRPKCFLKVKDNILEIIPSELWSTFYTWYVWLYFLQLPCELKSKVISVLTCVKKEQDFHAEKLLMGHLELDKFLWDLPHGKAQRVERWLLHPLPCVTHGMEKKTNTKLKKKATKSKPEPISQAVI